MKKKKSSKRSQNKRADLSPHLNLKTRYDLYDQDYLDKLSEKELDWLNKFNREYISGTVDRKKPRKNLHNTKKLIKDCDDRNNSRNRDVLTRAKAANHLADYNDLVEETAANDYEDVLIQELDKAEVRKAVDWLAESLNKDEERLEDRLINEIKDTGKSSKGKA
jgi:hypothetical protein